VLNLANRAFARPKLLKCDEARGIEADVAKLPGLLLDPKNVIFFPCPA